VKPSRRGGGLLFAFVIPLLFLHDKYQPQFSVGLGSKSVAIRLADFAVLAVVIGAAVVARRHGLAPLRPGSTVWLPAGGFLLLLLAACFYPRLRQPDYDSLTYLTAALKFCEYALLAPAAVLLLRRRSDVEALLAALVVWSAAMTTVGVLQFFGVVHDFTGRHPAQRETSYVGISDFSVLSAAALMIGLVALTFGTESGRARGLALVGVIAGVIGIVLAGAVATVLGTVTGVAAVLVAGRLYHVLTRARVAAVLVVTAAACVGVIVLRGSDFEQFARFLGVRPANKQTTTQIQTYSQRTLLAYIGYRIWLDHPIFGAGYLSSSKDEAVYGRYLAAARRKFPNTPVVAFPSPKHQWGVQIFYLQALADLGIVGLVLWLAMLLAALVLAGRNTLRGPPQVALLAGAWLLLAAGVWTAQGIVAGVPLEALAWIAVGLAVRASVPIGSA
jgi:O-antigen ligase